MSFARRLLIAAMFGGVAIAHVQAQTYFPGQTSARLVPGPRTAQSAFPLPPSDIPEDQGAPVILTQDSSSLLLRIDRLENQLRNLTGQMEQMQFQQRKLDDTVRRLQGEAEVRPADPNARPAVRPVTPGTRRPPTGDAFDPEANPNAPGAPRPLGAPYGLPSSVPGNNGPVDSSRPIVPQVQPQLDPDDPNRPIDLQPGLTRPPRQPGGAAQLPPQGQPPVSGQLPLALPADDYDQGINLYKQGQYADAEIRLAAFVQKNPRDKLVPEALYYMGETFFQRQRPREAAEQFLKISTDYSKSARAPDALVRLGMSLNALGAKEQACATFGEVSRKYPAASTSIRAAGRESKRAQC